MGQCLHYWLFLIHHRSSLFHLVLLFQERHCWKGLPLCWYKMDTAIPLRLYRLRQLPHRTDPVHQNHIRVLQAEDSESQQKQSSGEVPPLLHLLLPRLPWEMHQVPHQECLYPGGINQQELLSLCVERLPLGHQERVQVRRHSLHRCSLHVHRATLHH